MSSFASDYNTKSSPEDLNHYFGEKKNEEVWVEDPETGAPLAQGLQGCRKCDEAVRAAKRIANDRGSMVILHDDDGSWEIEPS